MKRHNYIVTYDVCDPKRLRQVFKVCKDFGQHLQLSVFECDLTRMELVEFEKRLKDAMNQEEDQALFIDLGPSEERGERAIRSLGKAYAAFDAPCFVA